MNPSTHEKDKAMSRAKADTKESDMSQLMIDDNYIEDTNDEDVDKLRSKKIFSKEEKDRAEEAITKSQEPVDFNTKEYPISVIVDMYNQKEFYIPRYQRQLVWDKKKQSKFIESLLLDLPIPYLYFADSEEEEGRLEIVDGSQRIQTMSNFLQDSLILTDLEILECLNGFSYSDLTEARKRRLKRKSLRSIELTQKSTIQSRIEIFTRINERPFSLTPMELRRGALDGPFLRFINECSQNELFKKLCPLSKKNLSRFSDDELISRYFAYTEKYEEYDNRVSDFVTRYIKEKLDNFNKDEMKEQFEEMLSFVNNHFPYGFKKSIEARTTPRVRFESISVGVTMALRKGVKVNTTGIKDWIESETFTELTTSDAANNKSKFKDRIEHVVKMLTSFN